MIETKAIAIEAQEATFPQLSGLQRSAIGYMDAMIADEQRTDFDLFAHIDYCAGGFSVLEHARSLAATSPDGKISVEDIRLFVEGVKK